MKKFIYIIIILFIISSLTLLFKNRDFKANFSESNGTTPINIVFITDLAYIIPTNASINSIIKNKSKTTKINIYVIGVNLTEILKNHIEKQSRNNTNIEVILKKSGGNGLPKNTIYNPIISRADYIKFYLPSILDKLDKVIYLDSDTIVLKDLTALYNIDLEDNYIGAADDWQSTWYDNRDARFFNNGVMLMNLKKMREDNIESKLLENKKNDKINRFITEDAFNITMQGKVKPISLKYDTFGVEYNRNNILPRIRYVLGKNFDKKMYPYKSTKEYRKDVVIIHYCGWGATKPWRYKINNYDKAQKLWWKYISKASF